MKTRTLHKALSMLLTVAMVLNMGLIPVFAEDSPFGASGLTNCHAVHNEACGYGETTTVTSPCNRTCSPVDSGELVHGEDCPLYTAPEESS